MKKLAPCAALALLFGLAANAPAQNHPYGLPAAYQAPAWTAQHSEESLPTPAPLPQQSTVDADEVVEGSIYGDQPWVDSSGSCSSGCCDDYGMSCTSTCCGMGNCFGSYCPTFYGSVGWITMTRNHANPLSVAFDAMDDTSCLMHTGDTNMFYQNGGEVTVGYRMGCVHGIEATYWTLNPFHGEKTISDAAGQINSSFDFRTLELNGNPVNGWFDNAMAQRIRRRDEFHNLEINYVHANLIGNPCSRFQFDWLAGARWFKFDENFLYSTTDTSTSFGVDEANEVNYSIETQNNLIGVQTGFRGRLCIWRGLSVYTNSKFGVYNNCMTQRSSIYDGVGTYVYDIRSNKNDVSLLGELDLGARYQFNCNWGVYLGYRVVGVTGIALTENQIPQFMDDLADVARIDSNGDMILHGAMAGITCQF